MVYLQALLNNPEVGEIFLSSFDGRSLGQEVALRLEAEVPNIAARSAIS